MKDGTLAPKLLTILPYLNEKQRRLVLAAEARSLGYGGISQVARVTGISRPTIHQGLRELDSEGNTTNSVRRTGGGRKRVEERDSRLVEDLEQLVDPDSRGDPMSPLRWTCKSTRQLAVMLQQQGHHVSHRLVAELLRANGYSLQGNAKTLEGTQHPERDAQYTRAYPTKVKVSNAELASVCVTPHGFHGEWNYTISPTSSTA